MPHRQTFATGMLLSRRRRRPGVGFGLRSPCRARLPGVWRSLDVCCASPSMAPLANNAGSMARSTPAPHQPGRQCTRRGRRPLRAKSCAPSARAHHAATRTESTAGRAVAGRRAGKTAGAMDGPAVVKMASPGSRKKSRRPGGFPPGRAHWPKSGNRSSVRPIVRRSLSHNHPADLSHRDRLRDRSRAVGGRIASWLAAAVAGVASWLAATVTSIASWLAAASVATRLAAARATARLPALLRGVERLQKVTDRGALLAAAGATARSRTAARLAAALTGVASWLAATVAGVASWLAATLVAATGVASWLAATVTGVASWLAATVTSIASWLAAATTAATVFPLALLEQPLQATEKVMLAALAGATAGRTTAAIAAAVTSVASWLAAAVTGVASWLAATVTGIAAGFAAAVSGIAAGLTARITARSTAFVSEHPVEELKTERLATNGHAENQRAEIHHTLHRATSPLLVNHRCASSHSRRCHPEGVIHELSRQACRAIP